MLLRQKRQLSRSMAPFKQITKQSKSSPYFFQETDYFQIKISQELSAIILIDGFIYIL